MLIIVKLFGGDFSEWTQSLNYFCLQLKNGEHEEADFNRRRVI